MFYKSTKMGATDGTWTTLSFRRTWVRPGFIGFVLANLEFSLCSTLSTIAWFFVLFLSVIVLSLLWFTASAYLLNIFLTKLDLTFHQSEGWKIFSILSSFVNNCCIERHLLGSTKVKVDVAIQMLMKQLKRGMGLRNE